MSPYLSLSLVTLFFNFVLTEVELTVNKPGEKGDVPVGVIVGSVIGGLVLLALAVALLWKVSAWTPPTADIHHMYFFFLCDLK